MKASNKSTHKTNAAQPQKTQKKRKPKIVACQTYRSRDTANGWCNKDYALDRWIALGGICTPDDIRPFMHDDISDNVIASWLSGFDRGGAHPGYPRSARQRTSEIKKTLENIGVTDSGVFARAAAIKDPAVPLQAKTAKKTAVKTAKKKKTAKK